MSKKASSRASATLVAHKEPGITTVVLTPPVANAPAINPPAVVVELLQPAPNAHSESAPTKPVLHVDQGLVDAFLHAEGEAKIAAVALFRACVVRSVAPVQFVGRSDAKIRASEFNCAFHVGAQFGYDNARRIVDAASEQAGDKRDNVLKALRKAREYGVQLKRTALKGAALNKALKQAGDDAVAFAEDEGNFASSRKNRGAQLPRVPKADTMEAFAPIALAALGDMLKSLGSMRIKARELERVSSLKSAMEECVDVLESFGKKEGQ